MLRTFLYSDGQFACLFWKNVYSTPLPILIRLNAFWYWVGWVFIDLGYYSLIRYILANIFSHSVSSLFNIWIVSLAVFSWVELSSVAQSCLTLCHPMNHSTLGLLVHHQLPEFTQTHVRVGDAIQPSHPLSSPSPPAPNPSQHQSLFQWVNSLHEVAKVLEFQL